MKLNLKIVLYLFFLINSITLSQQTNSLIVLNASNRSEVQEAIQFIDFAGGHVRHVFEPQILLAYVPTGMDDYLESHTRIISVHRTTVDPGQFASKISQHAAIAFNRLFSTPISTSTPSPLASCIEVSNEAQQSMQQQIESVQSSSGNVFTSSYLIGSTTVSLVLMESNGSGENWNATSEENTVAEVVQGLNRMAEEAYGLNVYIRWDYDIHYAVPTVFEPISGQHVPRFVSTSWQFEWIDHALSHLGAGSGWDGVYEYLNNVRKSKWTDWAYMMFVVMDENDADHMFSDGKFAYAFQYHSPLGGPLMVMTYHNDGWGTDRMDLVTQHETGHIFGASDEYASSGCTTSETNGYLNFQNGNCENANPSPASCVMRSRSGMESFCYYSRGQVGWYDHDVDGVMRPIDQNYPRKFTFPNISHGERADIYQGGSFVKSIQISRQNTMGPSQSGNNVLVWDASDNLGTLAAIAAYQLYVNGSGRSQSTTNGVISSASISNIAFNSTTRKISFNVNTGLHIRCSILNNSGVEVAKPWKDELAWFETGVTFYADVSGHLGGSYTARLFAWWPDGVNSTTYTLNFSMPVTAPSGLSTNIISANQISLTWQDNSDNEAGFKIERSTDGVNFTQIDELITNGSGTGSRTYTDGGRSQNVIYYYRVRSFAQELNSSYSNTANATIPVLTTPTNFVGTGYPYHSELSWNGVAGGQLYNVYRSTSAEGTYTLIEAVSSTFFSEQVPNAPQTYFYKVAARVGSYVGPLTNSVSVNTLHLQSTSSNATANNNQRKITQTLDGTYFMAYESQNRIWITKSSDGVNWTNDLEISSETPYSVCKSPSIVANENGNEVVIVWQGITQPSDGYLESNIFLRSYNNATNTWSSAEQLQWWGFEPPSYTYDATPVVSRRDNYFDGNVMSTCVAWRDPYGLAVVANSDGYWSSVSYIPATNGNSMFPSITRIHSNRYGICWLDGDVDRIAYMEATHVYNSNELQFPQNPTYVSPGGWTMNQRPSIAVNGDKTVIVTWQSFDNVVEGQSVHVIEKLIGNYYWGPTVTSFSSSSASGAKPVIGTFLDLSSYYLLWEGATDGSIFSARGLGTTWTTPSVIASGSSGGTNISAVNRTRSALRQIWKKSNNQIVVYNSGLQKTDNAEKFVSYRLNKHVITYLDSIPVLREQGYKGMIAFEIAGLSQQSGSVNRVVESKTENNKHLRSEKFSVASNADVVKLAGAFYAKGLKIPEKSALHEISHLIKVQLKDAATNEVVKEIWDVPFSRLAQATSTDGEFRMMDIPLSGLNGREVYLDIVTADTSRPIFVNDYYILSKEDERLKKFFEATPTLPTQYALHQNYPNPFNPSTTIRFDLIEPQNVILKVYNSIGQEIKTIVYDYYAEGSHEVTFDASLLSSGAYFYRIVAGKFTATKSFVLLK